MSDHVTRKFFCISCFVFIISAVISVSLNSILSIEKILGTFTDVTCASQDSVNLLVVKNSYIDNDHVPDDLVGLNANIKLRKYPAEDLIRLLADLNRTTSKKITAVSGYRSAKSQSLLKKKFETLMGTKAKYRVADPGTSEHELGTSVDLAFVNGKSLWQNGPTKELLWLDAHAHEYGYVLSYRPDNREKTGFQFEPWHWRWVGNELATKIRLSGKPPQDFYLPKCR